MVSAISIALFVGIPTAVIVGLGFLANTFRDPILSSARSLGEVFTGIFTEPVRGAVQQVSGAFSNLPDINVDIPSLNIGGGGITLFGEDIATTFGNVLDDLPDPMSEPTGRFDRNRPGRGGGVNINPEPRLLPGSLPVGSPGSLRRISREQVLEEFEGAIGVFDLRSTPQTEFLPLTEQAVRFFRGQGENLRISGSLFEGSPGQALLNELGAA